MDSKEDADIDIPTGILRKYFVADAHLDLLFDVEKQRSYGRRRVIASDYLPGFEEGGVNLVVSSLYIDDIFLPEMALRRALNQVSALYGEIEETGEKLMLCKSYSDIIAARESGKLGILLSFEGVEPLYNDISLLRVFYELGLRIVGLVWSRRNFAGDGSRFSEAATGNGGGLTDFGFELVREAENLGMLIDLSHLNDEGFWDAIDVARKPVIASHSNCRTLNSIGRNLTDEQIRAIASKDGVIGINASSILVAGRDEDANLDFLVNHIDHIVDLVGPGHVGLGFDLCNRLFSHISFEAIKGITRKPFDVLEGHKDMNLLVDRLLDRGYGENEIGQILGDNFLRVYEQVLK
ncbi:MAG: hypothetical protein HPY66_0709 [Firmicutes bacterium]|nr:hypothetical protein [Bacillota bacterium]MDI6705644.1 dipeptidase [Bacillota bacterium]